MYLIKRKNGNYYIKYWSDVSNEYKRISTNLKNKKEASKMLAEFIPPDESTKIPKIKLKNFRIEYESYIKQRYSRKYLQSIVTSFNKLEEFFGDILISNIDSHNLERFFDLSLSRSKYASFLYLRTLKAAFNKAIKWKYIDNNPFKEIRLPKFPKNIPEYITEADLFKIIESENDCMLKNIYKVAFYTGMRRGEIINLRWEQIDFENKLIHIKSNEDFTTKNNKSRKIPISKPIEDILLKKDKLKGLIFKSKKGVRIDGDWLGKIFKKKIILCGLNNNIHFHSLRHSFASFLVQKGASIYLIKELLGHGDILTTQIYSQVDNSSLASVVNLFNRFD